jgi:Phage tail tube protein
MSKKVAGVCYIKVDGRQYDLRGNLKVSPSILERETVAGMDGVHGYIERPRAAWIEFDITDAAGLSLKEIDALTGVTVTAELAGGKVYVLPDAWSVGARELDASQGQMTVRFEAADCEEMTA